MVFTRKKFSVVRVNLLPDNHDHNRFTSILFADRITVIVNKMRVQIIYQNLQMFGPKLSKYQ